MELETRLKRTLGGPFSNRVEVPVTPDLLHRLGKCLVDSFVKEAKKDFAKRGWSGKAEDGSAPIWDSFSYHIVGEKTVEITSTFPHIEELTSTDTKPYKMTWLTQQAKQKSPADFPITPREKKLGMILTGRVNQGGRLPLIVPLKGEGGQVIFRAAPLTFKDAWIHPGIAKFTFAQRAARQGREECIKIIKEEVLKAVVMRLSE